MPSNEIDQLLVRFISAVDLFKHIDLDDVAALLRQSARLDFDSGEKVFVEGEQGYSMYVVTKGEFEVYRTVSARYVHIAKIEPGEHFGEIALLVNRPRSASIRATKPSSVIRFSKQAIMSEHRAAALLFRNMAKQMAQRLISVDEEVILHKTGKYPLFRQAPETSPIKQHEYVIARRN